MTVGELKEELGKYPDDILVVLSKDEEGNGFSLVYQIDGIGYYVQESDCQGGELYPSTEAGIKEGWGEDYVQPTDGKPCIVLWP